MDLNIGIFWFQIQGIKVFEHVHLSLPLGSVFVNLGMCSHEIYF